MATLRVVKADGTVKAVEIRKLPSKGVALVRAASLDDCTLGVTKSGSVYNVHGFPSKRASYVGWTWHFIPTLAKLLERLEVITPADVAVTIEHCEQAWAARDKRAAVDSLERSCKYLGLELTAEQLKLVGEVNREAARFVCGT